MNDQDLGLAAFWDKEGRFASFPPEGLQEDGWLKDRWGFS